MPMKRLRRSGGSFQLRLIVCLIDRFREQVRSHI